jgi:hypothetical protein
MTSVLVILKDAVPQWIRAWRHQPGKEAVPVQVEK